MNKPRTLLALCLVSLLGACAQISAEKPASLSYRSNNVSLLEDAERIFALPVETQQKELALANENGASHDSQVKAAMVYTLVNSRYCSSAMAAATLAGSASTTDDDMVREKKWDKERKVLTKQIKDSAEENQKLAQRAHDEQARADSLQEKLDELKNIEKAMVNREQGTRK